MKRESVESGAPLVVLCKFELNGRSAALVFEEDRGDAMARPHANENVTVEKVETRRADASERSTRKEWRVARLFVTIVGFCTLR